MPIASKCVELAENNVELRRIPIVPDCANRLSERFVKPAVFRVAKEAAKRVDFLLDFFLGGAMNRFYVYGENTLSAVTLLHRRVQEAVSGGESNPRNANGVKWEPSTAILSSYSWDFPLSQKEKMERQVQISQLQVQANQEEYLMELKKKQDVEMRAMTINTWVPRMLERAEDSLLGPVPTNPYHEVHRRYVRLANA
eukprot:GEMP01071777.1.p1 GENE.GEMP01071777.1~~GEMP01071777.1.p1  ORF type:complete len:204 (+),score=46.45 GEMP01071777.1:22-612(+)